MIAKIFLITSKGALRTRNQCVHEGIKNIGTQKVPYTGKLLGTDSAGIRATSFNVASSICIMIGADRPMWSPISV